MPQNNTSQTLLRQWEILRMLTVSHYDSKQQGRWDRANEIAVKLIQQGYDVSLRTVQRDLKQLAEIFPIEINDKNPRDYGWRWSKGQNLNISGLSISEALVMRMVEMHLTPLLPTAMLDGLQSIFNIAKNRLDDLDKHNRNPTKYWLEKIRVIQPTQNLLPPPVNKTVQTEIYQALLESNQLSATYRAFEIQQHKEYLLNPLGLIMRGTITYLVATAWDYPDVRLYALHRFSQARVIDSPCKTPEGFNLDNAIANGLAEFAEQRHTISLNILCIPSLTASLMETPLAIDQTLQAHPDGRSQITATVNDTWQLRWWLLSQGADVEVCLPRELRQEIRATLSKAIKFYD